MLVRAVRPAQPPANACDAVCNKTIRELIPRDKLQWVIVDDSDPETSVETLLPPKEKRDAIFPPNPITGDFILFVKLHPRISKTVPGEKLSFTAKLSISNAGVDGMFNAVSLATFSNVQNKVEQDLNYKRVAQNISKKQWLIENGERFYHKNSFEFKLESLGVLKNKEVVEMACLKIIQTIEEVFESAFIYKKGKTTMPNSFDIHLKDDYTIGQLFEYVLYEKYYESEKRLNYVGFRKTHPHDEHSTIRLSFKEEEPDENILILFKEAGEILIKIFNDIKSKFGEGKVE